MNNPHNRVKWSAQETQKFLDLVPLYGKNYTQYTNNIDRTYSSIKGQYHNLCRRGWIVDGQVNKNKKSMPKQTKLARATKTQPALS